MPSCPVCGNVFAQARLPWLLRCEACGFEASTLEGHAAAQDAIDEGARAEALNALRESNFRAIVGILRELRPNRGRLLDVGCAHGWFLGAAAADGWEAVGIEPDPRMARIARDAGMTVRSGIFPSALAPDERFDCIVFNDVFEHLPDVDGALRACRLQLAPGGLLVVNLPDARGPFYRVARALSRFGVHGPLERMWQKGFPSPHLSYFTEPLLRRLAAKHGFRAVYSSRLPAAGLRGLWSRLRYDRASGIARSALFFAGASVLVPATRLLPPDISVVVFEPDGAAGAPGNATR
ncbi:MAG TPA: class I SAM-dependent methyltransferase [Myxococcales bacterium]